MTLMLARVTILGGGVIFIPRLLETYIFIPCFASFFRPRAMTFMLARVTILGGRGDFHTQASRNLHIYSMLRFVFQAPRYDPHVSQGYDFGGAG